MSALNRTRVALLNTNLDLGRALLEFAEISRIDATVTRNRENARRAYDKVLRFSTSVKLDETERQTLETNMAVLKRRLDALKDDPQAKAAA